MFVPTIPYRCVKFVSVNQSEKGDRATLACFQAKPGTLTLVRSPNTLPAIPSDYQTFDRSEILRRRDGDLRSRASILAALSMETTLTPGTPDTALLIAAMRKRRRERRRERRDETGARSGLTLLISRYVAPVSPAWHAGYSWWMELPSTVSMVALWPTDGSCRKHGRFLSAVEGRISVFVGLDAREPLFLRFVLFVDLRMLIPKRKAMLGNAKNPYSRSSFLMWIASQRMAFEEGLCLLHGVVFASSSMTD